MVAGTPLGFDLRQPVLLDARVELSPGEAEELGRARFVVARLTQRLDHERALDRFEVDAARWKGGRSWRLGRACARLPSACHGKVLAADVPTVGQDDRPFDGVAQLAHVARPAVAEQL